MFITFLLNYGRFIKGFSAYFMFIFIPGLLLLFFGAPSKMSTFEKVYFPDFKVRKRVIPWVFRHSPLKNTKNPEFSKISGKLISDPFLASKTDPISPFWAPFSVSCPPKSAKIRTFPGTNSGKLGFYRFHCFRRAFRGRSWSLRGRFRSLRASISEPPGPDFGAILHKPAPEQSAKSQNS